MSMKSGGFDDVQQCARNGLPPFSLPDPEAPRSALTAAA